MHKTQKTYAIARAQYDAALALFNEAYKAIEHLEASDFDLYIDTCTALNEKFQVEVLLKALHAAEDALIAWAFEAVSTSRAFGPMHRKAMNELKPHLNKQLIRQQVVDLSFRLSAR